MSESVSNPPTPKRRLSKGWIIFLLVLALLLVVFCPKKLSWLCPAERLTAYQYRTGWDDEYHPGSDTAALRSGMEDTWVVWTGWVNSIFASDTGTLFLTFESNEQLDMATFTAITGKLTPHPGQSLFSKLFDNEYAIYQSSFGGRMNRYVSLGSTLFELVPELGA